MDLFRKKDLIAQKINNEVNLLPCLTVFDLIFLGIGAIIGAGIFVLTGIVAATHAGPAIVFSYIIAGFACAFAALSYAELAALVGGCGSAYGYAYASLGEFIAWLVGWSLLLEYSISVSAVSVGWSGYCKDFLAALGIHIPYALLHPPVQGGVANILSFTIILVLTLLLCFGAKTSSWVNSFMVFIKLFVIMIFVIIASFNLDVSNWHPFMPFGWTGVVEGASLIFFAYIGFDAVSTAAEEAKNPQRDLPIGILGSLVICTFLYILVSLLLTGIVKYNTLDVSSPISHALLLLGHKVAAALIGVGAIAGLTTVMLVLFYGLTRVFFAMTRDGLLPAFFIASSVPNKIPSRVIIFWGLMMAIISALVPLDELAQLVNIGTLFAFMIVCVGVICLRYTHKDIARPFKTPGMPFTPILGIICCLFLIMYLPSFTIIRFFVWMGIGLLIYFFYGRFHSKLN